MKKTYECLQEKNRKMPYVQFLPNDYDGEKEYPMLIFLCGLGECGEDLDMVTKYGPTSFANNGVELPFILIAPQIPTNKLWFAYIESLNELLDKLVGELLVDRKRIYLTGLSNGGVGTWLWGTQRPGTFAALIPICGEGIEACADRLKNTPVWAFHGDCDPIVSPDSSRRMVELINANGGDAKLTMYSGVGHDSWSDAYKTRELYEWMLSKSLCD